MAEAEPNAISRHMLKAGRYVAPSAPVLVRQPPSGGDWLHEVKFDGWRAQLHKAGGRALVLSRRGSDMTKRFKSVADAVARLRCETAIIDAEVVACGEDGAPDFEGLMRGEGTLCAWCFDVLLVDGIDQREQELAERRRVLRRVIGAKGQVLRLSEVFKDGEALLAVAEEMGLEGIVSKKAAQGYVSGRNRGWLKCKTASWRERNRDRWEMFAGKERQ